MTFPPAKWPHALPSSHEHHHLVTERPHPSGSQPCCCSKFMSSIDHEPLHKSPQPSQGLPDTVHGQRAEDILRPHNTDLTKLRPGLGYGHWGSESGAMTDRYLHLLAQGGHPRPQPARSWAFSALPSSGLLGLSLHSGTKAQCSVRGGIPVQKRAGRQGGQPGCAGTLGEAPGHIRSLWKCHHMHAQSCISPFPVHLSAQLR